MKFRHQIILFLLVLILGVWGFIAVALSLTMRTTNNLDESIESQAPFLQAVGILQEKWQSMAQNGLKLMASVELYEMLTLRDRLLDASDETRRQLILIEKSALFPHEVKHMMALGSQYDEGLDTLINLQNHLFSNHRLLMDLFKEQLARCPVPDEPQNIDQNCRLVNTLRPILPTLSLSNHHHLQRVVNNQISHLPDHPLQVTLPLLANSSDLLIKRKNIGVMLQQTTTDANLLLAEVSYLAHQRLAFLSQETRDQLTSLRLTLFAIAIFSLLLLLLFYRTTITHLSRRIRQLQDRLGEWFQTKEPLPAPHGHDEMVAIEQFACQFTQQIYQQQQAIEKLSTTDKLTGLENRGHTDKLLSEAIQACRRMHHPLVVIFFDLDHFKQINDQHGHLEGDQVLQKVATTTAARIRSTDILGRWGGEEFLLICSDTPLEGALQLAEVIRLAIAALTFEKVKQVTASIGVASFQPNWDEEQLLQAVDAALYRAKAGGRNRIEIAQ
ncbi:MAG: GGDEF domain-containing protein [Gammaproteobacteria bacterium]|nr:GGDEF domain-containing protein [Gammaproteobacteria bacterium]